jgi:pimeloyl-[acyl-carrier protein] methyl ester esterase
MTTKHQDVHEAREPVIGLIHGWAMHGGLFGDLCGAWPAPDWRRLDLPGHGQRRDVAWPDSTPALLDAVLEGLPDGAWLCGWSLGGLLAMQAALREPERFAGLVLIAATPSLVRRPHWDHAVEPAMLKAMAMELAGDPVAVVQRFLALEMHGAVHARSDLKRLRERAFEHGLPARSALTAGLHHLAETDVTDRLSELGTPVALIGGRRDKLVPWAALEILAERLPRAEIFRISGAAHAPFLTDPAAVAAVMRGWIESQS